MLEKLIAEAARTGGLTALTIWPAGKGWQCNVRRRNGPAEGWSCVTADDPVAGIVAALQGAPVVYGMTTDAKPQSDSEDIFG